MLCLWLGLGVGVFSAAAGCDSSSNLVNDDGGVDGDGNPLPDVDPLKPDGMPPPQNCTAGATQCSNCLDDDNDGLYDGFDPECTGGADNDEGSFATGIDGDNIDAKTQDCFFDGTSGGGDDKCASHTCCLTDVNRDGTCNIDSPQYEPAECVVTQDCKDNCAALTPPGCDCFGCCTVCDSDSCRDIATNPAISPGCDLEHLDDPSVCLACVKNTECGGGTPCGGETCILCPGQLPEDLPPSCNETQVCPPDTTVCTTTDDCEAGDYCASGCCIANIG